MTTMSVMANHQNSGGEKKGKCHNEYIHTTPNKVSPLNFFQHGKRQVLNHFFFILQRVKARTIP